ncbi:MAG: hypothetical protein ACK5ZQ_10505 [bacterium]
MVLHDHTYLHPDAGRGMFALFYMVVFANALAYAAWFPVVGRLKASVASSALLVQRAIGPFDMAALVCVLGAIALIVRRPAPPPALETPQHAGLAVLWFRKTQSAVAMDAGGLSGLCEGQELRGGDSNLVRCFDRQAMGIPNNGPVTRLKIMSFQCAKAWGANRATLKVRRLSGISERKSVLVPLLHHQGRREKPQATCASRCQSPERRIFE